MTANDNDASLDIDEIFNRLKETQSEDLDSIGKKNNNLTYEELKKKVSHLPSIQLHLINKNKIDEKDKVARKPQNRKIQKFNDTVESVLPSSNKKTVTDRRLIKEEKSKKWFDIPKVEMTDDIKRDLLIVKNRKYLDPKRFYRGEKWEIPENFQMGEIVEGVGEYGGRLKRKQKGQTLVDELLKNKESSEWFSKTFIDIQTRKKSGGKKYLQDKISKRKKY
jgi:mRNA-binding protein PUF3